jgi:hypothetical protein
MPVGMQATVESLNAEMSQIAMQMRNVMQAAANLSSGVNGQGTGLATLEAIGFGSDPNTENPGSISDAQLALNSIAYLNTVAGVYYGTATQATEYDFYTALSQLLVGM